MRLFVIEQKDLQRWLPPPASPDSTIASETKPRSDPGPHSREVSVEAAERQVVLDPTEERDGEVRASRIPAREADQTDAEARSSVAMENLPPNNELAPWEVLMALVKNKRGMTGFVMTFIFGSVMGMIDPT
jgi:hypothetical protein